MWTDLTVGISQAMAAVAQTATASGGTVGVSSQWTFGTGIVWVVVVVFALYVLYRRFGLRPPS
jgi:uncharacterized membrane protein